MVELIGINKSDKPEKKFYAEFKTDSGRTKRTYFGAAGMKDMTRHPPGVRDEKRRNYLARHRATEDWTAPMTAGALSRWILWETPNLQTNIRLYKKRFGFT